MNNIGEMKRVKIMILSFIVIVVVLAGLKIYLTPRFKLPELNGPYGIGEINLELLDEKRDELYTDNESDKRRVMVTLWYPLESGIGDVREYPTEVLSAITSVTNIPQFIFYHFSTMQTHIYNDGNVPNMYGSSPLIIFSPGNNSTRYQNMAVVERLVSEGYTVLAVDHPYTSFDVRFVDGTTAKRGASLDMPKDNLFEEEISIRADDLSFVLNSIKEREGLIDDKIKENIDFNTIGAFGHSYGGATIAEFMARDKSIQAGLSYDGGLWGTAAEHGFSSPFLYLLASETYHLKEGENKELSTFVSTVLENIDKASKSSEKETHVLLFEGYNHYSFTDLILFSPLLSKGEEPLRTTIDITVDYFDFWLKQKPIYEQVEDIYQRYPYVSNYELNE